MVTETKSTPNISEVAKDIIELKFNKTDTLNSCMKKFFTVMRKHGIKQGTPTCNDEGKEVGTLCDNSEWTMCRILFMSQIESFYTIEFLFGDSIPDDLLK